MEEIFEPILDEDENLIKVFKPIKSAYFIKSNLTMLFIFLFAGVISGIGLLVEGQISFFIGEIVLLAIGEIIANVLFSIYYKNIFYAYSTKRIIIRSGIFGVDFKSLDIDMIGASTVNVSLLDKIIKKDTGCIKFGSMASPLPVQNGGNYFVLSNVSKPYEIYKEIKSYIGYKKKTINKEVE